MVGPVSRGVLPIVRFLLASTEIKNLTPIVLRQAFKGFGYFSESLMVCSGECFVKKQR